MTLLSQDGFLSELAKLFQASTRAIAWLIPCDFIHRARDPQIILPASDRFYSASPLLKCDKAPRWAGVAEV
jgi:hypothetical protein